MRALNGPQPPGEGTHRRSAPEKVQVSFAIAVRRPEPSQGDGHTTLHAEAACPPAVPPDAVAAEPDLLGLRVRPHVVNVPVRPTGRFQVMCQACPETTGTVGAAHAHVESGLKLQAAELADTDGRSFGRFEDEGVGSRLGLYHALDYTGLLSRRVEAPVFFC
jgi:hypothetical protein